MSAGRAPCRWSVKPARARRSSTPHAAQSEGIICADISEFASYMPSHAVGSPSVVIRAAPGPDIVPLAMAIFTKNPILPALGRSASSNCLPTKPSMRNESPVTLPPGRDSLAIKPRWIGSASNGQTIGTVCVTALAATAAGVTPTTITSGVSPTSSFTSAGKRSGQDDHPAHGRTCSRGKPQDTARLTGGCQCDVF